MTLKVFRPTGTTNQFKVVGTEALQSLPAGTGQVKTFSANIPVQAGDQIGIWGLSGGCAVATGNSADTFAYASGADTPQNTTNTHTPSTGFRWNISAKLEPDADGDGFGDETQEGCPTDPARQDFCGTASPIATPLTTSGANPVDKTKPALGSFSFSNTVFKAAKSGAAFSSNKSVPTGTKVSFNLSEASSVKFTVQRKTKGRKVGHKCTTKTKKNAAKKSCTLWKAVKGSFTVKGNAGKNTFTFRGRMGGKSLTPGSYRLSGTATDPSKNTSVPKRKGFKIVR